MGDGGSRRISATRAWLDAESGEWVRVLRGTGAEQEAAVGRLHGLLLRIARNEVRRRGVRLRVTGPELDDLAHQAAADALLAITAKIGEFRGESRFTTWAYKFVVFEVSARSGGRTGGSAAVAGHRAGSWSDRSPTLPRPSPPTGAGTTCRGGDERLG